MQDKSIEHLSECLENKNVENSKLQTLYTQSVELREKYKNQASNQQPMTTADQVPIEKLQK